VEEAARQHYDDSEGRQEAATSKCAPSGPLCEIMSNT